MDDYEGFWVDHTDDWSSIIRPAYGTLIGIFGPWSEDDLGDGYGNGVEGSSGGGGFEIRFIAETLGVREYREG